MEGLYCTIGGEQTSSNLSLALSLLFALGQIGIGGAVAYRLVRGGFWRRLNMFILLLMALWFLCSGITELFVSGMEALRQASGMPDASTFALWRGRADTFLLGVTVVLTLTLIIFGFARKLAIRRSAGA